MNFIPLFFHGAVEAITGYTEDEFNSGKPRWNQVIHPDDLPNVYAIAEKLRSIPDYSTEREYCIIRKDGQIRWVHEIIQNICDNSGKPILVQGALYDITERKAAEAALRKSEEEYRSLVESTEDSVYLVDRDCRYLFINGKHLSRIGMPKDQVICKTYGELHSKDETEEFAGIVEEVFDTGKSVQHEHRSRWDNRYALRTLSSVKDSEGRTIAVTVVSKDISERKEAEEERGRLLKELEAKNRELERFTYTVSHDLRSPLVSIQGFTNMLQKDLAQNEVEKTKDDLAFIYDAATKMDRLLSDTLKLSRIGRMVNLLEDVPFAEIIEDALEQTTGEITSNNIEVSVAEDFPTVHVDRMRIAEVLVNLIANSITYRGDQPSPKIEVGHRIDNGERVFFVKDNGIGMDKSQHKKVFDLFYRVDRGGEGTGAGLAIVKRIIEVHNGRIWIESEKGKGCTVCFTLPYNKTFE
jgi:PAS domain S-box-containing protein